MYIDFEEKDDYIFCTARCFNFACLQNRDTSRHDCDNGCQQTTNTGKCKNFKGEKPEEPQIKYEVCNPFSIIDIYKKAPCSGDFIALLKENGSRDIDASWNEMRWIKKSPVLMRNLTWLGTNGFIKKKEEKWINIYLTKQNNVHTGNHTFGSVTEANMNKHLNGNDRYIASVLKR